MKIETELFEDVAEKLSELKRELPVGSSTFTKWLEDPKANYAPVVVSVATDDKGKFIGWSGVGTTRGSRRRPAIGVFVDPKSRGSGLGEKLLRSAVQDFLDNESEEWYGKGEKTLLCDLESWPKMENILNSMGIKAVDIDSV